MDQVHSPSSPTTPRGPYQYYQPPKRPDSSRRSFAERSSSTSERPVTALDRGHEKLSSPLGISASLAEPFEPTHHDEPLSPTSPPHDNLRLDTETPPPNLRSKSWSPDTTPERNQARPQQVPEPITVARRGSVPEKSPLQKLEAQLVSKEQKRAKLEHAEELSRLNGASIRSRKRHDSIEDKQEESHASNRDDHQRIASQRRADNQARRRQHNEADAARAKFQGASDALRHESSPHEQAHPVPQRPKAVMANDSRPYNRGSYAVSGIPVTNTATSNTPTVDEIAAARGKAAYERRKQESRTRLQQDPNTARARPSQPAYRNFSAPQPSATKWERDPNEYKHGSNAQAAPVPLSRREAVTGGQDPVKYEIPPQVASAQQARQQVHFGNEDEGSISAETGRPHRVGALFHRDHHVQRSYQATQPPLEEWRSAKTARLTSDDLVIDSNVENDTAWWGKQQRSSKTSRASRSTGAPAADGPYEESAKQYRPQLFTKCGPLLRYTGIRQEANAEVWHGSIMIVTDDRQSDYATAPTLRIFAQPMSLHEPAPRHMLESGQQLPPDVEDPVAGQVKLSRTGRPLFVRPVHDIDAGVDLSMEENPRGLYAATRTPVLGPQNVAGPDGRQSQHITFQDKSRVKKISGETVGQYREVRGFRLLQERGCTFWRFNIAIELNDQQRRVAYRINKGPAIGFWVPARGQTMNIMFHSCNGFSLSVDPDNFSGPDPLWRDVLNKHQSKPFHVMIGGGDQIYNDAATRDTELFREWLLTKNREAKHGADFTPELQDELEEFYLQRYAMWFSQGLFAMANSQIPMVNIWDDHDIIDGYGSYPHHFMSSPVFTGLGAVAFKYYMLFQHQSLVDETEKEEPSWLLGGSRGPYINQMSRSIFLSLGNKVAFLGLDCRTERMRDEILSEQSYNLIFSRCRQGLIKDRTRHLIVLLGVPIAYPRLNFLENILTSRIMDPVKALGRTGMLGGFVNKFDGGVEVLDDLDDHWTAKHHKAERNWFIQELQELAAELSVRITILGGDVHLGAVGQFYTPKRFGVAKDKDHRYMPNIISSAIVNTPPPNMMADVLNKRNKVHHLDHETDEDLIPIFPTDVDGSARNNKRLLPRRNFCTICEYVPGTTPPPSPLLGPQDDDAEERGRQYPPSSIKRTMSLTRNPAANLVRRLSNSRKNKNPPVALGQAARHEPAGLRRASSLGAASPSGLASHPPEFSAFGPPERRPSFHRRPTDLSDKQIRKSAARGDLDAHDDGREPGHIDLEHGLDISLHMEIDQRDPGGKTVPYRLLVPALWYDGAADINTLQLKSHRPGLLQRLGSISGEKRQAAAAAAEPPRLSTSETEDDDSELDRPPQAVRQHSSSLDDTYNSEDEPRRLSISKTTGAWKRGYELGSPPVGAQAVSSQQPAYRRASEPHRGASHDDQDGSLTPDSFISGDDQASIPANAKFTARRQSKAEKFLGIGGDDDNEGQWQSTGPANNRRVSLQEQPTAVYYPDPAVSKRKPAWKVWQRQ